MLHGSASETAASEFRLLPTRYTLHPNLTHPTLYTLQPTPHSPYPTLNTLHPTPYTLHWCRRYRGKARG